MYEFVRKYAGYSKDSFHEVNMQTANIFTLTQDVIIFLLSLFPPQKFTESLPTSPCSISGN